MWDVSRQSCQSSAARARARTKTTLLLVGLLASTAEARIEGLVTAVFSPFDASGEVDTGVVPLQQAWLNATGVAWVFVTGTTGESLSLSVAERKQLTDAWIATGTNVIAHVGAESIRDARALASHAAAAGAKAVGAMPPTFFKPATAAALASTISSICAAAAPLPCYYYHIPSMTGVNIPMIDFVKAIEPLAPTFAGIKYTGMYDHPGMMGAQRVLEYKGGKYEVLSGREEMMLEALSIGIRGHVAGDLYNRLIQQFDAEGLTRKSQSAIRALQSIGIELIDAWQTPSPAGTNGNKHFMNLAGVPVGDSRLPYVPLDTTAKAALQAAFAKFCAGRAARLSLHMCAHVHTLAQHL